MGKGDKTDAYDFNQMERKIDEMFKMMKEQKNNADTQMKEVVQLIKQESDKAEERYQSLATKFEHIELRTSALESKVIVAEQAQSSVVDAVQQLEIDVNKMQQEKLNKNIVVRGVPEKEASVLELKVLFMQVLAAITPDVTAAQVLYVARFGEKRPGTARPILVKFNSDDVKQQVLKMKKKTSLNCSMFNGPQSADTALTWGAASDVIFFGDHLTTTNNQLLRSARKLREDQKVQFVWIHNGTTFVRRAEGEAAVRILTADDINQVGEGILPRRSTRRKLISPEKSVPDPKKDKRNVVNFDKN